MLAAWVDEVRRAADDPNSPLALWAALSTRTDEASAGAVQATLERWRQQRQQADHALDGAKVVLDYANCGPADWQQDGFAFGLRPVRVGEFQLSADPGRPVVRVYDRAAAFSHDLALAPQPAPGTQGESGRLNWLQSSRTLRSPSFRLTSGKLWYLVRGSGNVYAAVDSHRMNNGPLHGAFIRKWKGYDQYQWVEHNLSAYAGRRLQLEFTPAGDGAVSSGEEPLLSIAMLVEADRMPGSLERPDAGLLRSLPAGESMAADAVAQSYQQTLLRAAERFGGQAYDTSDEARDDARLADWLFSRPQLWSAPQNAARHATADAAKMVINSLAGLAARAPKQSALAPTMFDGSSVDEFVLFLAVTRRRPASPCRAAFWKRSPAPNSRSFPLVADAWNWPAA